MRATPKAVTSPNAARATEKARNILEARLRMEGGRPDDRSRERPARRIRSAVAWDRRQPTVSSGLFVHPRVVAATRGGARARVGRDPPTRGTGRVLVAVRRWLRLTARDVHEAVDRPGRGG